MCPPTVLVEPLLTPSLLTPVHVHVHVNALLRLRSEFARGV